MNRSDKLYQEEIKASYGEERYKIQIVAIVTEDGISLTITGGEKPHVGGMALSIPRPSRNKNSLTCDTWLCPVPEHKDVDVARFAAEKVSLELNQKTAVTAGIHIDQAKPEEIERLLDNCKKAIGIIVEDIKMLSGD